jgi:hypothetical protein
MAVNAPLIVAVACSAGGVAAPSELVAACRLTVVRPLSLFNNAPRAASSAASGVDCPRLHQPTHRERTPRGGRVDERVWRPNVASSVGEVKSVSNDMQVKLCRAHLGQ